MSDGIQFHGFPPDALTFFAELSFNNNRAWFEAHKTLFNKAVQLPAQAFVHQLGARLTAIAPGLHYDPTLSGRGSIMRLYRDVRFSQDKSPYRTNLGIVFWLGEGKKTERPGYYFELTRDGAGFFGGVYQFDAGQLEVYRQAVLDAHQGAQLAQIVADLRADKRYRVGGEHFKRVPRNIPADHPRADLLRHNGLYVVTGELMPSSLVTSPELMDVCLEHAARMAPLLHWLAALEPHFV